MQQPLEGASSRGGAGSNGGAPGRVAHPVLRYGLVLGLLNGLFGILQVITSSSAALENHATVSSFYYGVNGTGFDVTIMAQWLAPMLSAAYGSCLLAFVASMWLCWHAGRASATAAGYSSGASVAGLLASVIGSGIWIAASVVAVLLLHTDGTITGVLTTTPDNAATHQTGQLIGLLGQEVVAAAIALGFGAIAGAIGGRAARVPSRMLLARAPLAPMPAYPPHPAAYYPPYVPGGYQYPGAPVYPPQPQPYRFPPAPGNALPMYPFAPPLPYGMPGNPPLGQSAPGDAPRPEGGDTRTDAADTLPDTSS